MSIEQNESQGMSDKEYQEFLEWQISHYLKMVESLKNELFKMRMVNGEE